MISASTPTRADLLGKLYNLNSERNLLVAKTQELENKIDRINIVLQPNESLPIKSKCQQITYDGKTEAICLLIFIIAITSLVLGIVGYYYCRLPSTSFVHL